MKITISKAWTDKERLRVINLLSAHASAQLQVQGSIPARHAFDMFERINLVATAPVVILEENVAGIFEGMGIERVEAEDK